MSISPKSSKAIVSQGYDRIAQRYLAWTSNTASPRVPYVQDVLSRLPSPSTSSVLELGCGAGVPVTKLLAERCGRVVANDVSSAQIELARQNCPGDTVELVQGDMTLLEFPPATFDVVTGHYSIIHLPREEQAEMIAKIYGWLKPGGYLLCNLGIKDNPGRTDEGWMGTTSAMYWSGYDAVTNVGIVKGAGFEVVKDDMVADIEGDAEDTKGRVEMTFQWILARKPGGT